MEATDNTDYRQPLPITLPASHNVEEIYRPDFELDCNENADIDQYIEVMNSIAEVVPDPEAECNRRRRIWDRLVELVGQGVSTAGSRALGRIILSSVESVDLSEYAYDLDCAATPEAHVLRQDPGEQGKITGHVSWSILRRKSFP